MRRRVQWLARAGAGALALLLLAAGVFSVVDQIAYAGEGSDSLRHAVARYLQQAGVALSGGAITATASVTAPAIEATTTLTTVDLVVTGTTTGVTATADPALTVSSLTVDTGDTALTGSLTVSADADITGAVTIGTTLEVSGIATLLSSLAAVDAAFSGAVSAASVGVTGVLSGASLSVTGALAGATIATTGDGSIGGDLAVVGSLSVAVNAAVTGALDVDGATTVDALTVGETLGVTGIATLSSTLAAQDVTAASVAATGAVSAGTTLGATGLTTLDGGLTVSAGPITGVSDPYAVSGLLLTASSAGTVCTLSAGWAMDSTGLYPITAAAALTVDLGTTGAGGLDALCVAIAANTEYDIHIIGDSTGVAPTVAYVSTGVAPTLPAGYDLRRRIAYCRTAAASAVLMRVVYTSPGVAQYLDPATDTRLLAAGSEITYTEVDCSSRLPASATAIGVQLYCVSTGTANTVVKYSCSSAISGGQVGVSINSAASTPNQVYAWLPLLSSQSVWYNAQDADIDAYLDVAAFRDNLTVTP